MSVRQLLKSLAWYGQDHGMVQMIFLDVFMPKMDGIKFISTLVQVLDVRTWIQNMPQYVKVSDSYMTLFRFLVNIWALQFWKFDVFNLVTLLNYFTI